jgi:PAS domain S-box-containing protein
MGTATDDHTQAFRHVMDSAPVMIWVAGTDRLCSWFNKPWLEFTGRTLAQECGNGWAEGVHPDDLDRCLDHYVSHFDRHMPFRMEYRLRRADGEYRWILDTGVPRFDAEQRFLGYIGSCIDITALKQTETGLKDSVTSRDLSLDALDRIAGGLAHEFSNLVAAFVSDLWAIRKSAHDPIAVRQRAAEAEEAAIQGGRIIDQLVATVRQRPKSQAIHVNQLVEATWTILRGTAGERVSIEMDLAAAPDDVVIDAAHLQAALLNLVANARDAMSEGGMVKITTRNVTVRPETLDEPDLAPGRYIMLAVGDNGSGMSEDVLRHAFEPFFTTKDVGRGTGLGLSQVRAFAKHSGGTAHIDSGPAKGTTVRIYLPQGGPPADAAETRTM